VSPAASKQDSRARPAAFDPLGVPLGGRHLIEASAGTGKTFTLALLYVRMVLERGLSVRSILVVTFTRAATSELSERIRARLRQTLAALSNQDAPCERDPMLQQLVAARLAHGEVARDCDKLAQALASFDEAAISTIHHFCQRALEEHAFGTRTDPDSELTKDDSELFAQVATDFHANHLEQASPRFYAALRRRASGPLPTYLEGMARVFARAPVATLLPEASAQVDVAALEREVERAHDDARACYPGGEALIALLLGSAINRGTYRVKTLNQKWRPALDAHFNDVAPEALDAEAATALSMLTPEALAANTNKGGKPPAHPFFEAVGELVEAWSALDDALAHASVQLLLTFAAYTRSEVPLRKARASQRSFSDLLVALHDALMADDAAPLIEALRTSFGAALVDEFQDTDPIQYAIFDRLFGDESHPLFLIGDPKQAIYGFRGADIFAYLRAAEDARSERHTLTTNWRSDPALLRGVATLFDTPAPFLDPRIDFVDVSARPGVEPRLSGAALRFLWLRRDAVDAGGGITAGYMLGGMPRLLARHVAVLLLKEPSLSPPDIAVLTGTNHAAAVMQAALLERGIPAVLESTASVFASVEAEEVEILLRALLAPTDVRAMRSALVTGLLGYGGKELLELSTDEARWDALAADFGQLRHAWFERGMSALAGRLLDVFSVTRRLLSRPGGERSLMNTLHVFELLGDISSRERLSASSLVERFHALRVEPSRRSAELKDSSQLRLESDASAVRVTTIHKSKGLEYPIVYAPFVYELGLSKDKLHEGVRFHDPEAGYRETLDLGSPDVADNHELAKDEAFAEGMRLFYVALTRAKYRAYVVWGATRGFAKSAPAWLLHGARCAAPDESPRASMIERVKPLDDDELEADLQALVTASRRAIAVEDLTETVAVRPTQIELDFTPPPELVARGPLPDVRMAYRVASFSSLKSFGQTRDLLDGRDRDQGVAPEPGPEPVQEAARVILADFPSGTGPGHVVHEVFERYAFESPETTPLEELCTLALQRRGFDPALAPKLSLGMIEALNTPLGEGEPSLHEMEAHRAELEFFLSAQPEAKLDAARLADVFRKHGAPAGDPSYADHLAQLTFPQLTGYLHGFVDLIFRARGRYYVVDYKTNHLGDRARDYAPAALLEPMAHHHYHLQYQLYVVAMVGMLRRRVPDFDYDTHFGGVRYLFVRGMSPAHDPSTGVYAERPTAAFVADLERALMGDRSSRFS